MNHDDPTASSDSPGVITHPPFIYAGGLLIAFGLHWLWPMPILTGPVGDWVGGLLIVLGLAVAVWAIVTFVSAGTNVPTHKPSTTVVSRGPYRFSRNPIYVGLTAVMGGIGLMANTAWVLILLVPTLLVMHYGVILREERYLEAKFGADYRAYAERVRRWL